MPSHLPSFEIPDTLKIVTAQSGLSKIIVTNDACEAEIYLHGGHLTHFQVHGEAPTIFDAKKSIITPPKSVHAGVPVCWPWFGPHPTDSDKPQHGFVRDRVWKLHSTKVLSDKETEVVLTLEDDVTTHTLFPHKFLLELTFTLGASLNITLKTTNTDKTSFTITQALHSYFAVADIEQIQIRGVENTPFVDYTDDKKRKIEHTALKIHQETNRVYIPTDKTCYIDDLELQRTITVRKTGSNSTTIWNPWRDSGIHDLPQDRYRNFVCIETTNALDDAKVLLPNTSVTMTQTISTQTL